MRLPASLQKKAKAIRLVPEPWLFRATPASGSHWVPASWCSHAHGIEKAGAKHLGISVKINSHNPSTWGQISRPWTQFPCVGPILPVFHRLDLTHTPYRHPPEQVFLLLITRKEMHGCL